MRKSNLARLACAAVVAALAACASAPAQSRQPDLVAGTAVAIQATPVAMNGRDPAQDRVGRFVYAGGLEIVGPEEARLGGLSDLEVLDDGRVLSVTDEGQLFQARLQMDSRGRLTGLADVTLTPLAGLDGRPLPDKTAADAEGIARLASGDWLVSFERQHRVWRYPAAGGAPAAVPFPASAHTLPLNTGLEALAAIPAVGPGAYLVGSEEGMVWLCDLAGGCRETSLGRHVPEGYGLPAIAVSPDGELLVLVGRAFDAERGVRVIVRLLGREAIDRPDSPVIDELALVDPLTRDNFEGAALVRGTTPGSLRLYLLSDNNYSSTQRTYLLAFDWSPNPP